MMSASAGTAGDEMDAFVRQIRERMVSEATTDKEDLLFQIETLLSDIRDMMAASYGPCGMNKLVADPTGDIYMTSDGKTLIKETDILHPAAVALKRLGQGMNKACGDGTKTAIMTACNLLLRALPLMKRKVHPSVIVGGYEKAIIKLCEMMDYVSEDASPDMMISAVRAAAFGKGLDADQADRLADACFRTVLGMDRRDGSFIDLENHVKILKKQGAAQIVSVNGVILDEKPARDDMPTLIEDPRILLIRGDLKPASAYMNAEHFVRADSPEKRASLKEARTAIALNAADKIASCGADVIICEGAADPAIEEAFAGRGILLYTRVKVKDMDYIARASNAGFSKIFDDAGDMARCLGRAGCARVVKKRYDTFLILESDGPVTSVLITEPMKYGLGKIEEAADDALNTAAFLLRYPQVVTGAGGTEYFLARALRIYANTIPGKEQLAVMAFADAVEDIAKTLAKNIGMDVTDAMAELSARQTDGLDARLDVGRRVVENSPGVYDCAAIRKTALISAAETAVSLLRVDGIFLKK